MSFSELNSSLNLFNDPIVASNYLGLCEMFRCANLPHWCDSFIALVSLFQNDFSGFFEDQAAIEAQLKYKVLNMLTSGESNI